MENELNYKNILKKRIKILVIFIISVMSISIILTVTYKSSDNQDENEIVSVNISDNEKKVYSFKDDKVHISDFNIYEDEIDGWVLKFFVKNITNESVSLDESYRVFLYDSSGKVLDIHSTKIFSDIKPNMQIECMFIINCDASKIAHIEIKKN